ncbi:MAG: aminodeoxychorismate synthase component I [Pseudomonadota bacterium]
MSKVSSGNLVVHPLPYVLPASQWFERIRHLALPVMLTSGNPDHPSSRYEILAADPLFVLKTHGVHTSVTDTRSGQTRSSTDNPFDVLATYCPVSRQNIAEGHELPFNGGAIGYFGYDLLNPGKPKKQPEINLPDMLVGIYDWAVIVDHDTKQTNVVFRNCEDSRQLEILATLQNNTSKKFPAFMLNSPFISNVSKEQYLEKFNRIIDYIHEGDCYQVNLAQCFSAKCEGDGLDAFLRLQKIADAPFAAYLENDDQSVLCFSPERFLQVKAREVTTQPIKGTRPRSADPATDAANQHDLETSQKDRAENLMIVDLLRNDLGRICETGSVKVDRLFEVQSFTNVHHLVSTISGRLESPDNVFDLMAACFPGGSITGTPKIRAMEIINELETTQRSVYCGSIAYIDHNGNMDSNIAIRTLVRDGNSIHCWGGGGIVADSKGNEEFQETLDKISILLNNL